jgi:hypothetical protein
MGWGIAVFLGISCKRLGRLGAILSSVILVLILFLSPSDAVRLNEFAIPSANTHQVDSAAGPDGNLCFTEVSGNKIERIIFFIRDAPLFSAALAEEVLQFSWE